MTATDWCGAIDGDAASALAYADWLEENGFADEAAMARLLPQLADELGDVMLTYSFATYVDFRLTPAGSESTHGYRMVYCDRLDYTCPWVDHPAAALVVAGSRGHQSATSPVIVWIEEACGLLKTGVLSPYSREGYTRVRFKRRSKR